MRTDLIRHDNKLIEMIPECQSLPSSDEDTLNMRNKLMKPLVNYVYDTMLVDGVCESCYDSNTAVDRYSIRGLVKIKQCPWEHIVTGCQIAHLFDRQFREGVKRFEFTCLGEKDSYVLMFLRRMALQHEMHLEKIKDFLKQKQSKLPVVTGKGKNAQKQRKGTRVNSSCVLCLQP